MTKGDQLAAKKCITPKGRVSYPAVFHPSAMEDDDGGKKHSITLLFDGSTDLTVMKKAAYAALVKKHGADRTNHPKKFRLPFRDGTTEKPDNPEYAGKIFVTMRSADKPQVIDRAKRKLTEESGEFYAGCYAACSCIAFWYEKKGNKGISFALRNVIKLEDGEKLSGGPAAEDEFDHLADGETSSPGADGDDPFAGLGGDDSEQLPF